MKTTPPPLILLKKSCFIASSIILTLFIVTACNFEANAPGSIEIPAKPDEDPIPPEVTDPLPPTEDEKIELLYVIQAASIYTYTNESNTSVPTGDNSITIAGEIQEPVVLDLSELVDNAPSNAPEVTLTSGNTSIQLINFKAEGGNLYAERQIIDFDVYAQIEGGEEKHYTFNLEFLVHSVSNVEVLNLSASINDKLLDLTELQDEITSSFVEGGTI